MLSACQYNPGKCQLPDELLLSSDPNATLQTAWCSALLRRQHTGLGITPAWRLLALSRLYRRRYLFLYKPKIVYSFNISLSVLLTST